LTLTPEPGRRDQKLGPELGRFCCRRRVNKSSTTPQSMRKRRRELMTRPTVRPALSGFVDVDAARALRLVLEILVLLLVDAPVDVDCDPPPGVGHGATPKLSICMSCLRFT